VLSRVLLGSFPNASVVSLDLSPNMVETCKRNLAAYSGRVEARRAHFGEDDIGSGYDLVVSGFAIHHLTDAGKQELYNKIFRALKSGGIFINRELVLGATPALTKVYENCWREFVHANGEGGEDWFKKYVEEDIPASVEDQTAWLKRAGFTDVGCHWRHLGFAIFGGRKP
jgi:tRNA (cmo5U34)-methyltransferase